MMTRWLARLLSWAELLVARWQLLQPVQVLLLAVLVLRSSALVL